jgi:hypothetical protein
MLLFYLVYVVVEGSVDGIPSDCFWCLVWFCSSVSMSVSVSMTC